MSSFSSACARTHAQQQQRWRRLRVAALLYSREPRALMHDCRMLVRYFCEKNMLAKFVSLIRTSGSSQIKMQVIQSLSILVQNINNETSLCTYAHPAAPLQCCAAPLTSICPRTCAICAAARLHPVQQLHQRAHQHSTRV